MFTPVALRYIGTNKRINVLYRIGYIAIEFNTLPRIVEIAQPVGTRVYGFRRVLFTISARQNRSTNSFFAYYAKYIL